MISAHPPVAEVVPFDLVPLLETILQDSVVAVSLFGSAVIGGLKPRSDVDVLVLVRNSPDSAQRQALVAGLMKMSARIGETGRPLEVSILRLDQVVPWQHPARAELIYGEWLREDFEAGRIPPPAVDPDLTIVLKTARDNSVSLSGPALHDLIEPIPIDDVRRAMRESLPTLLASLRGDEHNVLLTLARMWVTHETAQILPKDQAAAWALERLPETLRPVLERARTAYLAQIPDPFADDHTVAALAGFLRTQVQASDKDVSAP